MKTVYGEVLSTKSVSLSQAARTIAAFVSFDNGGASQAVATYLKRTSAAFNELVQFHKDHKTPNFKINKNRRVDAGDSDQVRADNLENGGEKKKKKHIPVNVIPVNVEGDGGRKKEKRKEGIEDLERGSEGNLGNVKHVGGGEGDRQLSFGDGEGVKDKEKKKIEAGSENLKKVDDLERKKKKKKINSGGRERGNEDNLRIKEKGKEKKRKGEEIVDGEIGNSSEQSGHKKKKRRRAESDD